VISIRDDRLWQEPIPELQCLRYDHRKLPGRDVPPEKPVPFPELRGDALEIIASFDRKSASRCGIIVRADGQGSGTRVWADAGQQFGIEGRVNAHFLKKNDPVELRVFVDRGVLEVYCNGVAVTHKCFAPADRIEVLAFSDGGEAGLMGLEGWKMKSMWE
jgi:beta-fructofuranosidase